MSDDSASRLQEESSRKEYVRGLLANGHLEGAVEGIAKLFLDKGESALTGGQIPVFLDMILGNEHGKICKVCGPIAEWGDRAFVVGDPDGYCPRCRRAMDKD